VFVAWRGGRPVQFWSTSSTLPGVGKAQGNTPLLTACAGPSSGKPMIANVAQARPLWRSEAVAPDCWGTGADARYRERAIVGTLCGGASSPVVADGIVYLYSYRPSGDVVPEGEDAKVVDAGELTVLGTVWSPEHDDTTAYGQMALGNVVVDGRLIVRGMDGIYCYDLRVE